VAYITSLTLPIRGKKQNRAVEKKERGEGGRTLPLLPSLLGKKRETRHYKVEKKGRRLFYFLLPNLQWEKGRVYFLEG